MTILTVWCFAELDGARRAERELAALSELGLVVVDDASLVFWPRTAVLPQTRGAGNIVHSSPLAPTYWGLLYGLAFAAPMLEDADTQPRGLHEVGIDGPVITRLRQGLRPGSSGLLAVMDAPIAPEHCLLLSACGAGTKSFDVRLSDEQTANLHRVFGSERR